MKSVATIVVGGVLLLAVVLAYMDRRLTRLEDHLEAKIEVISSGTTTLSPARCVASLDPTLLRAELERAVSQLRSAQPPAEGASASPPSAVENDPADTALPSGQLDPDVIVAFDRATEILEEGMASGSWSRADRVAFIPLLGQLDEASRRQLIERLIQSINTGKLVTDAAPLDPN